MSRPLTHYASFHKAPFLFALTGAGALPGPVLVDLMVALDGSASANKSVLSRMVAAGLLDVNRVGRVGVYRLAGSMARDFVRIRDRLPDEPWDGRFHVILHDQPDAGRPDVERFRAAAVRRGYRTLRPGVLVSGHFVDALTPLVAEAGATTGWLELDADAAARLAAQCWELADLHAEHERAIEQVRAVVAAPAPAAGVDALVLLHETIRPITELALRCSGLPAELAPDGWPAAELLHHLGLAYAHLAPAASAHAREVLAASPHAGLAD